MHNGAFDLDETLRLYNAGMITLRPRAAEKDDPLFPKKSPLLKPLGLNAHDLADLREFLESLTESNARVRVPALPQ
jgi:cytochrome c peroxidase